MSIFEALILGIVQGLTEFLPVSSSGHLILFQKLFGFKNLSDFILFDMICHLGTLGAIFTVFYREICLTFLSRKRFFQILLATLPLFPLVLILKPIKNLFNQTEYLGFFFLTTAFLLFLGQRYAQIKSSTELQRSSYRDALKIGSLQTLAIIPGISRSGSTISCARLLGWKSEDAITFSFILSIPVVLGGICLELLALYKEKAYFIGQNETIPYLSGFLAAFIIGIFTLKALIQIAIKDRFSIFIWYCLILGVLTLYMFH